MKKILFASLIAGVALFSDPSAADALEIETTVQDPNRITLPSNVEFVESYGGISRYKLKSNGMPILLIPNHAAPVFTFMVVYHVGSRNEAPGNTGSAHLLEHMIFNKSTEHFGRAKGHKTFQEVLYEAGADFSSTNMTTWYDRMNGYSTLPADKLELAMKIEADRLGRALILDSERQPEMSVVRNEFEIGENDPGEALDKAVIGAAIVAHPYHWSTIGYRSDIEAVSTDQLRQHYKNFFWPDNAEAILVGDFEPAAALRLFDQQFGSFSKSDRPIPKVVTIEPPQEGERRVMVRRPGKLGLVQIAYMRPGALDPDFMALDLISNILAVGVNSRLRQALVEPGLASDVSSWNLTLRDPYPISVFATVSSDSTHQKVEDALKAALTSIGKDGVTDVELKRAKEQLEVSVIQSRDGTFPLAATLGEAVASADWKWFADYIDRMKEVNVADIQRVAALYLVPEHATVGWFVPTDASRPVVAVKTAVERKSSGARTTKTMSLSSGNAAPKSQPAGFAARTVRRVLPNGLILDIVENHAVPTVAVRGLIFAGGSNAPAGHPALPLLTSNMIQRGTRSRTKEQIAALMDGAGATLTLSTTAFETNINGGGMSRDLPMILEVLADELRNPSLDADELTRARSELKNEVQRAAENTGARAVERLTQLAFPSGHPYRAAGHDAMIASLERATVADLKSFHKSHYSGSAMILAIVGYVDTAKTVALVEKFFAGMSKGTRPGATQPRVEAGKDGVRQVVTMPGKANMNFIFGHASGLRRGDPDYESALIANAALGQNSLSSRIGKRVRDTEGLSYNLNSRFNMTDLLDGIWLVNVNVAPSNLSKAMKSTREEIDKFVREGITEEEVAAQKSFFAGNYQVGLGSNGGVASALVTAEKFGYGPQYLDEFPARIRKVTRAEANAAIEKHLYPLRLNLIIAGDLQTVPE